MPRDLAGVLHYFVPELEPAPERRCRTIAIPLGRQDVVRAALVWDLAVELTRRGLDASVLASDESAHSALWPDPGPGPMGTPMRFASPVELRNAERDNPRPGESPQRTRVVLVCLPPDCIDATPGDGYASALIFSASDRGALGESFDLIRRLLTRQPRAELGITLYGAPSVPDAEAALARLRTAVKEELGGSLRSYGVLVDDLDVYRAILERRPVGLARPHSAAARTLAEVARRLESDLRRDPPR